MNNNTPLVSIITPSFNQGQYVEETIKSVINQTYSNIEYIFIDGGSTDETMQIVEKYKDKIDLVIHERDKGQANAINKGFKLAKGVLIGWINSDDILYPNCVEKIVELYNEKSNGSIYYGSLNTVITSDSSIRNTYITLIDSRDDLLTKNYNLIQPGSFYKSVFVSNINYLDEELQYALDLDLWLRLLMYGKIYRIDNCQIAAIRDWDGTKTSRGKHKFLKEIRLVLLKNGGSRLSATILRTYWYQFKILIKSIVRS